MSSVAAALQTFNFIFFKRASFLTRRERVETTPNSLTLVLFSPCREQAARPLALPLGMPLDLRERLRPDPDLCRADERADRRGAQRGGHATNAEKSNLLFIPSALQHSESSYTSENPRKMSTFCSAFDRGPAKSVEQIRGFSTNFAGVRRSSSTECYRAL